jgi:hypothetical protein
MNRLLNQKSFRRLGTALAASLLWAAAPAQAVQFTLSTQAADTWTYTLTYDPMDNYAVHGLTETATIRLTGLSGVTSASGPTSTDFDDSWLSNLNMAWTPTVLNGGTEVLWSHIGPGTGNFSEAKHVYGFTVTAPGAVNGTVGVATTMFTTDVTSGYLPRDISASVAGPVPEPEAVALTLAGLAVVAGALRRQRKSPGA